MANKGFSVGNVLLIIGGLLMIISIFLAWTQINPPIGNNISISGMDIISGKVNGNSYAYSFKGRAPLFLLIIGILSIILALLPMFKIKNNGINVAATLIAVLGLVFAIMFLKVGDGASLFTGDDEKAMDMAIKLGTSLKIQFGAYFGMAGSAIAMIGGLLSFKK